MATVSFSLTTGITPCEIKRSNAFSTFLRRSSNNIYFVNNSCATVILYSENKLSYKYISSHCPTAAQACFPGVSLGRSIKPSLPIPRPIAPLETKITSCPAFCRSASVLTSCSTRRMFNLPVRCVNVEVPTLTTIRFLSLIGIILPSITFGFSCFLLYSY